MKTGSIVLLAILAFMLLLGGCACTGYNSCIALDETAKNAWAGVETDYQRRSDLIPNLVNVVQGEANFEKSTLTAVIEARASATQVKIDISNATPEQLQKYQAAQGSISQALGKLMVVSEKYPDLKANLGFRELAATLEGTENRIKVSRNTYNEAAKDFNLSVRTFPMSVLANTFGFKQKPYFEADKGAEKAPTVKF